MTETSEAATMMHAAASSAQEKPRKGQGKTKPLAFRAVRGMVGAVAVTGMPNVPRYAVGWQAAS